VGCPIKSDQAIRSLCLKGHVRARGSTLWRHRWPEASEFFCTKTPLFEESWTTKDIAINSRKCFLWRATNVTFSKFRGWRRKKKPRLAHFFETALRAVLINKLIQINSRPKMAKDSEKLFYSLVPCSRQIKPIWILLAPVSMLATYWCVKHSMCMWMGEIILDIR